MRKYFLAEKLKYQHTYMKGIVALMPLILVMLAAGLTREYFAVDSYNWWYMILYPGLIGIVCGMIGGKDKKKRNYTIGSLPCNMDRVWDAKVAVGAVMSGVSILWVSVLSVVISEFMEEVLNMTFVLQPSVKIQFVAGFIIWLTALWQIPFCLWLSQRIGSFLMFIVHMGSCFIISATVSLESWFVFLPGAITSRLMCPILGILPNGLLAVEGQMTYSPELVEMNNLLIGIPAAILWFVILWKGSRRWFERQVGV